MPGIPQRPATLVPASDRLDRLPPSRWLAGVMGILFLGWLLESYDIGLTGSVLPSLTHVYQLGAGAESLVAVASTVGIVLGIVPAGWLADRWGRKPVLVWGTVVYAVLSFATAFAANVDQVVALRLLAGLAMGAVFPLPYSYAAELCPPSVRGRLTGVADSFLSVGYFLSPVLAAVLIRSVNDPTGWRVMFLIGVSPLLFAVLAWRFLPESPRWYEAKGRFADSERALAAIEASVQRRSGAPLPPVTPPVTVAAEGAPAPGRASRAGLGELFRGAGLRRSVVLWVTFGGTFFVFYSIQVFMPTVVSSLGFTLTSSFVFTAVIVAVSIPGKLLEAWVVERWGRRPVIITFGLVAAVASAVFGFMHGAVPVLLVGCVMSFFGIGVDPAVKVYTTESYPTPVRATGTAATEGFGRFLSGILGPALVPPLLAVGGAGAVYLLVGGVALVAVLTVAVFGEETRGRALEAITERPGELLGARSAGA